MEKKIARIYRWLERCAKACSAGSWSSALLDMECAKAELEDVRSEIWTRAEDVLQGRPTAKGALLLRVSCLSIVLLFAFAAPLAMQSAGPASRSARAGNDVSSRSADPVLEWVTGDEQAVLAALRKSLSEANRAWVADTRRIESDTGRDEAALIPSPGAGSRIESSSRRLDVHSGAGSGSKEARLKDGVVPEPRPSDRKIGASIEESVLRPSSSAKDLDSILSLVQIGRKALRERESPIQFQRP